jgi:hypothetical protein
MDKKAEYMNFPVTILQGAFKDVREAVDNIIDYQMIREFISANHSTQKCV